MRAGGARALALLIAAAVDANVAVCNISVEGKPDTTAADGIRK
jgi:hypothetical protein